MIDRGKIKIVLFDIDNTLVYGDKAKKFYSEYSRCLERVLASELKITVEEAKKIADDYRQKYNGHGERSFITLGLGMDVWFDGILSLNPQEYLCPLETSVDLIKTLKKEGFVIGAITDGPRIQASRILEAIQLGDDQFDFIIGWERGKEFPKYGSTKIYKEICKKYSVNPNEVVMIGDSLETDIFPAKEVGLNVIYVGNSREYQCKSIENIEELYTSLTK